MTGTQVNASLISSMTVTSSNTLRVLLIAYEFYPLQSAQSLRWTHLSRELQNRAVDVTVLSPNLIPEESPPNFIERRIFSFAGPFVGISGLLSRSLVPANSTVKTPGGKLRRFMSAQRLGGLKHSFLNNSYRFLRALLNFVIFMDVRTEWFPFAALCLKKLEDERFDLVLASHEPGVDLMLGLYAARKLKIPLVVDLADPLVPPYMPMWQRAPARFLEKLVVAKASHLLVTAPKYEKYLRDTYSVKSDQVLLLTQGFDASLFRGVMANKTPRRSTGNVLFAGNFYPKIREPRVLFEALALSDKARLVLAGHINKWLLHQSKIARGKVDFLGRLQHIEVISLIHECPLSLSFGNSDSNQVPGKFFEYLGGGNQILHIYQTDDDPIISLAQRMPGVHCVAADARLIADKLDQILSQPTSSNSRYAPDRRNLSDYSWEAIAGKLYHVLVDIHEKSVKDNYE